jgi:hypothetical protein
MMSIQLQEEKITRAREALQRSRELKRSRRAMGVDGIRQFVKDVDGDWLDNWTDTEQEENIPINSASLQVLLIETFLYFSVLSLWFISLPFLYKSSTNTEAQSLSF